ncbi:MULTISPECIES: hypothetical protein [unclassified Methylophilus]|uniref:hypothetical protein n=1 Tax=unclassified Methylophilus TaxID=2630143 RepID=UPI0006FE4195|nr:MULTISPECIES: hypothetical protein [unclassified Methylophilus]KQT41317.1 hypothetical protein ASG34_11260 [Methylophilus sp. Leaf416]KQT57838.1 hypothetical protein ASG44_12860 [Methylophilus sp. Leaf459]
MGKWGWWVLGCSQVLVAAQAGEALKHPLGQYDSEQFITLSMPCAHCQSLPQAQWYFKNVIVAVPAAGQSLTSFSLDKRGADDVASLDLHALPDVVWTGSTHHWTHTRLSGDGKRLQLGDGKEMPFGIVPKIPTNLSYWNQDTQAFYAQRALSIRGEQVGQAIVARTLWPEDFRLNLQAQAQPLQRGESLKQLVQYEQGGAHSPHESRLLWQKAPGVAQSFTGKAVLGVLLNGAQGDDDEAHGGHFALTTGIISADGSYHHWLVNNYYNLATNSEKGIIAGVTPFDKYMADLNSGQAFYRPSYMLVAVFSQPTVPATIQAASNRTYQHFYRNDFVYDHALNNCAGISVDVLHNLGWKVPEIGGESLLKASAAYWYMAATERSLTKGRAIYDYLNTEMTRLFPAVAFDAIGNDLLNISHTGSTQTLASPEMQAIASQIEAIYFVRIPQIPSSRVTGLAPVYSFEQYLKQAPADRSQWKIIPVTPNPLPDKLKNGLALKPQAPALIPLPAILFLLSVIGLLWFLFLLLKRSLHKLFINRTKS